MTDQQKKAFAILLRLAIRSSEVFNRELEEPLLAALAEVEQEVGKQKPEVWVVGVPPEPDRAV